MQFPEEFRKFLFPVTDYRFLFLVTPSYFRLLLLILWVFLKHEIIKVDGFKEIHYATVLHVTSFSLPLNQILNVSSCTCFVVWGEKKSFFFFKHEIWSAEVYVLFSKDSFYVKFIFKQAALSLRSTPSKPACMLRSSEKKAPLPVLRFRLKMKYGCSQSNWTFLKFLFMSVYVKNLLIKNHFAPCFYVCSWQKIHC